MDLEAARQLLPDLEIVGLAPMEGGESHTIYELETQDGRRLVLKRYSDHLHWKLAKEAYLFDLVQSRLSFPAPAVVCSEPPILVMARLPGSPARLGDVKPVDVSRQLGALLRELHTITFESFGYIETGVTQAAPTNLEYMRRRIERKVRNGPPALGDRLARYFEEHEAAFAGCETAVLCHNDAHDANVLVAEGRITGIVDWENAVAADPLLDLAKAWAFSDWRSDDTLASLLDGYGPVRPDWREAFELYIADHLLELWVWFDRIGRREPLDMLEGHLARRVA